MAEDAVRDPLTGGPVPGRPEEPAPGPLAVEVVSRLVDSGRTLATAESLTGGLLGAAVTDVAGSSAAYRGGVVAYATDRKQALLGVDHDLLARLGPVCAEVAESMAAGARAALVADLGVATTGVAGPEPQDGHAPGDVYVAVAGPDGVGRTRRLDLPGSRAAVRTATVEAALELVLDLLDVLDASSTAEEPPLDGGPRGSA